MSNAAFFGDLSDVYEAMINWPKRLANEGPFYRQWFDRIGARRVADVACGTGHHAALFHSWGLVVEGSDLQPQMIQRARQLHDEPSGLRWQVRGFDQPVAAGQPFDAVICVGNSLPLAGELEVVRKAIREMLSAVRPGGLVILHALNLWRLPDGPCQWQKCQQAALARTGGPVADETLILKGVHRSGRQGFVDLVLVAPAEGTMAYSESVPFLGLEAGDLEQGARAAGAATIEFYGGYQQQPYDRDRSMDLIAVVKKEG